MSSAIEVPPANRSPNPRPAKASGIPNEKEKKGRVSVVLQGKGGVGKTLVCALVIQCLLDQGKSVVSFDTDPVQNSLHKFKALNAEVVNLLTPTGQFDVDSVDTMFDTIIKGNGEFVIDNGAASFFPMTNYLLADRMSEMLEENGIEVVIHTVITGGAELDDTSAYVNELVDRFPPSVRIVVWINEFLGPVEVGGKRFEETPFFEKHRERLSVVTIPQQNPQTTGIYVARMLKDRQIFAEFIKGLSFPAQKRITDYRKVIWDQVQRALAG